MIQSYIGSGTCINQCENGLQPDITGYAVFTGFLDQHDSNCKAYNLACENAAYLRSLSPCVSDATTTTSTTTLTTTPMPEQDLLASGNSFYNWTGDFNGETNEYYDIVSWGATQGYLSGQTYSSDQYFSYISSNDLNGYGVVLAIIKGSGLITGFGNNSANQLDIPANLTGVIQVSVGSDHVLALKNDGTITGFGRDNWNALNFNSNLNNRIVRKVCAGVGSSVFLLDSGIITGTPTVGGGIPINYPNESGFLDVDHYLAHVLAVNSSGIITGFGANTFGESESKNLNGISKISAGFSTSMAVYNEGHVTGYGTDQAKYNTPNVNNSGVSISLKAHIGTILKKNQDIEQWVYPWNDELPYINSKPSYLQNNIVAISQAGRFTTAIFKRPYEVTPPVITGQNCLWKVTYVGGFDSYGGISLNDLYPSEGEVVQSCDNYTFSLPEITQENQEYQKLNVPNCVAGAGFHDIYFESTCSQNRLLNINYTVTGYAPKTGIAGTGITTGDYWNPMLSGDIKPKLLYYADQTLSPVSGGYLKIYSGFGLNFSHVDNMYATFISGSGQRSIHVSFNYFPTGNYIGYFYGHGTLSGHNTAFIFGKNADAPLLKRTSSSSDYDSSIFEEDNQYVTFPFTITNSGSDYVYIYANYYLNGIQFMRY